MVPPITMKVCSLSYLIAIGYKYHGVASSSPDATVEEGDVSSVSHSLQVSIVVSFSRIILFICLWAGLKSCPREREAGWRAASAARACMGSE